QNAEDLINIGAYKKGSSKDIDEAMQAYPQLISFLKQDVEEAVSIEDSVRILLSLMNRED
ncbi:hypothetical protein P279_30775, partial [Rhodobacteraceae bacterium PD-2]